MKAIVITIYVACVLLFSGFARAEGLFSTGVGVANYQIPVQIEHISLNAADVSLDVYGYLPNPCYSQPAASLVQDQQDPTVLILRLTSRAPTTHCVSPVVEVQTTVNLPYLAQSLQLPLENKAKYLVKTEGYEFTFEVLGSDLLN